MDTTIETARETRQTSTLLGRIRLLPDIGSSNHNVRQFAERTAINTPIQGTAADLIKVAMISVDRALRETGSKAAMLLSVHDELVFEVPPDEMETVTTLVHEHHGRHLGTGRATQGQHGRGEELGGGPLVSVQGRHLSAPARRR